MTELLYLWGFVGFFSMAVLLTRRLFFSLVLSLSLTLLTLLFFLLMQRITGEAALVSDWHQQQNRWYESAAQERQRQATIAIRNQNKAFAAVFQSQLSVEPEEALNWLRLGKLYLKLQMPESAVSAFDHAHFLTKSTIIDAPSKQHLEAQLNLAVAILLNIAQQTVVFEPPKRLLEAQNLLKDLLRFEPGNVNAWIVLGSSYFDQNDFNSAKKVWTKALSIVDSPKDQAKLRSYLSQLPEIK